MTDRAELEYRHIARMLRDDWDEVAWLEAKQERLVVREVEPRIFAEHDKTEAKF